MKTLRYRLATALIVPALCLGVAVAAPIFLLVAIEVNGPLFAWGLATRLFGKRR